MTSSFSGVPTPITFPAYVECWYACLYDQNEYCSKLIIDPIKNNNKLTQCEFYFNKRREVTINIKLSGLFDPPVNDWRSVSPVVLRDNTGSMGFLLVDTDIFTLNGVFHNGLNKDSFMENNTYLYFGFDIYNSSTGQLIDKSEIVGATLTIGSKVFEQYSGECWVNNNLCFYESFRYRLPTQSDIYNINWLYGTEATLKVPNYRSKSILVGDNTGFDFGNVNLTPE